MQARLLCGMEAGLYTPIDPRQLHTPPPACRQAALRLRPMSSLLHMDPLPSNNPVQPCTRSATRGMRRAEACC